MDFGPALCWSILGKQPVAIDRDDHRNIGAIRQRYRLEDHANVISVAVVDQSESRRTLKLSIYEHIDGSGGSAAFVDDYRSRDVFHAGASCYATCLTTRDVARRVLVIVSRGSDWQRPVLGENGSRVGVSPVSRSCSVGAHAGIGRERRQSQYQGGAQHWQDTSRARFH